MQTPDIFMKYGASSEYNYERPYLRIVSKEHIGNETFYKNFVRAQLKSIGLRSTKNNIQLLSLCHELAHHFDNTHNHTWFMKEYKIQIDTMWLLTDDDYRQLPLEKSADIKALEFIKYLIKNNSI
jgi:hypothetical protein